MRNTDATDSVAYEETGLAYHERTYRLRTKDGKFAWIWDDTGEIKDGKIFDTLAEAEEWAKPVGYCVIKPK